MYGGDKVIDVCFRRFQLDRIHGAKEPKIADVQVWAVGGLVSKPNVIATTAPHLLKRWIVWIHVHSAVVLLNPDGSFFVASVYSIWEK